MSELQDALKLADRHGMARLMPEVQKIIEKAARLVANPDNKQLLMEAIHPWICADPKEGIAGNAEKAAQAGLAALGIDPPEET